jgi:hypothetical protein
MDTERRKFQRHRVLKGASISFNNSGAITCTVRNLSDGGACLDFGCAAGIPQNFTLVLDADQVVRQSRVVWKKADRIGVAFH